MSPKTLFCTACALLLFASIAAASPTKFPTGLTKIVPGDLSPGWVVFTGSNGVGYVVDADGNPVHTWVSPDPNSDKLGGIEPIYSEPGNVLAVIDSPLIPGCNVDCGKVVEMDWDGNVVWEYTDDSRTLHHDLQRLENGNTMFMCSKTLDRPEIAPVPIVDDCIIEVTPAGEVIWEWQTADHYDDLDLTDEERQLINDLAGSLQGDWTHGNAIDSISSNTPHVDPRFRPGNVIVSYRHINLVLIVDRDTDEVVWQSRAAIGQHHSHMIENGLVGAGNIMVFDNGFGGQYPKIARINSQVIEINPLNHAIVRNYTAASSGLPHWTFFSSFSGSAQRLPNGNTFIAEAMFGRAFEITPEGEIVWEFINPTSSTTRFPASTVTRYYKAPVEWAGPFSKSLSWPAPARPVSE